MKQPVRTKARLEQKIIHSLTVYASPRVLIPLLVSVSYMPLVLAYGVVVSVIVRKRSFCDKRSKRSAAKLVEKVVALGAEVKALAVAKALNAIKAVVFIVADVVDVRSYGGFRFGAQVGFVRKVEQLPNPTKEDDPDRRGAISEISPTVIAIAYVVKRRLRLRQHTQVFRLQQRDSLLSLFR